MRTFLSESNLIKAAGMASVMTAMSLGRLMEGGLPLALYIPATFLTLMLVCGTVTAWGASAGMPGLVPQRRLLLRGLAIAGGLSALVVPLRLFWLNPVLYDVLLRSGDGNLARLSFPPTLPAKFSLLLWSAGFQFMSLQAAPMSIAARLTGRRPAAVALCIAFRAYVMYRQIATAGITESIPLFVGLAVVGTLVQCIMFARFGLLPALALAAGMDLHLFFGVPG